ncbi:3431_t:CDS:1, partial [Cetraspora pellucida]
QFLEADEQSLEADKQSLESYTMAKKLSSIVQKHPDRNKYTSKSINTQEIESIIENIRWQRSDRCGKSDRMKTLKTINEHDF